MPPWTALLESLHSALIDELTERHPKPKPTLGMPIKQSQFSLPQAEVSVLVCEFKFDPDRGFALLAFDPAFMSALRVSPLEFWQALIKRAGGEFRRKLIFPQIDSPREFTRCESFPTGYPEPSRVIWIPFQIPAGSCFLGLAV